MSYSDEATARSLRIPARPAHIITEYSADNRNWTLQARDSLHIQKLKPPANMKNKIEKFHELFDVRSILALLG